MLCVNPGLMHCEIKRLNMELKAGIFCRENLKGHPQCVFRASPRSTPSNRAENQMVPLPSAVHGP